MTDSAAQIAVISDIHGNLQALESVLKAIDERGIDTVYCCGDLVGYGAHPNECVALIQQRAIPMVIGNHDYAALDLIDSSSFNSVALQALNWTHQALTPESVSFLTVQPMRISFGDIMLVHASPSSPERWNYILSIADARENFACFEETVCFLGHSHQPFTIEQKGEQLVCPSHHIMEFAEGSKCLVNVGSVGQPRDNNPDAAFAVYTPAQRRIEIVRVAYDIQAAQQAILAQGLPQLLAIRLSAGS